MSDINQQNKAFVMDFWKRDGNLLLENWVMIDLIGAALESGVDLLATLPQPLKGLQHE